MGLGPSAARLLLQRAYSLSVSSMYSVIPHWAAGLHQVCSQSGERCAEHCRMCAGVQHTVQCVVVCNAWPDLRCLPQEAASLPCGAWNLL